MSLLGDSEARRHEMRERGVIALDWQKLYDWTLLQPAGAVLGESRTNTNDPLGRYLDQKTRTQHHYWSIGPLIRNGYEDRIPKPEWVKKLIELTDQATGDQGGPITREVYLKLLEQVKPSWRTDVDQSESLSLVEQAIRELEVTGYETGVRAVQTWLRQRGIALEASQVKMDMQIVRSLMPYDKNGESL